MTPCPPPQPLLEAGGYNSPIVYYSDKSLFVESLLVPDSPLNIHQTPTSGYPSSEDTLNTHQVIVPDDPMIKYIPSHPVSPPDTMRVLGTTISDIKLKFLPEEEQKHTAEDSGKEEKKLIRKRNMSLYARKKKSTVMLTRFLGFEQLKEADLYLMSEILILSYKCSRSVNSSFYQS